MQQRPWQLLTRGVFPKALENSTSKNFYQNCIFGTVSCWLQCSCPFIFFAQTTRSTYRFLVYCPSLKQMNFKSDNFNLKLHFVLQVCGGGPSLALWHLRSLCPTTVFDAPKCHPYAAHFYEDTVRGYFSSVFFVVIFTLLFGFISSPTLL